MFLLNITPIKTFECAAIYHPLLTYYYVYIASLQASLLEVSLIPPDGHLINIQM